MLLRLLFAIILPPVSVYLATGIGVTLIINVLLTFLGWIPGIIHALWILNKQAEQANV